VNLKSQRPSTLPFWQTKALAEMSQPEWESLCDGCGKCCLHKLLDEDKNEVLGTNVACKLLDLSTCRCTDYLKRKVRVPDCVQLSPEMAGKLPWLPPTCAYRLLAENKPLPYWHPLVSGRQETVHTAGISVRGRAISEKQAGSLESHLVDWPDL